MKKIGLTAAGLLALAFSASSVSALAAPAEKTHDAPPSLVEGKGVEGRGIDGAEPHGGFPGKMPPPLIPLYQASMQTDNPSEGLNKLLSALPQKSGGHYEVRVSVVELPPAPPTPAAR